MVMPPRFFDGWDSSDSTHEATWYQSGFYNIGTPGRFGVGGHASWSSLGQKVLTGGPWNYMAAGMAVRWSSLAGDVVVLAFGAGGDHCRLRRDASDQFYIEWHGGTEVYPDLVVQPDTWYHVALAAKWNATTGQMRAWVEGHLVLSKDNIDTDNIGTTPKFQYVKLAAADTDDFYVCAEDSITGSLSDEFLGDLIVRDHLRQTDGDHLDWTPLSGSAHYQMIDEIGPDDDTSYLTDATPGNRDCGSHGTLAPDIASIRAVQLCHVSRFETTGPHSMRNYVRNVGIANHDSAAQALTSGYVGYHDVHETDPVTGLSWTKVGFEARQYGIKDEL